MLDNTLQINGIRKKWRESLGPVERVHWAKEYAKVRFAIACKTPPAKNKRKKKKSKDVMLEFWRLAHAKIEDLLYTALRKSALGHAAWEQSFEYAQRASPVRSAWCNHTETTVARLTQYPHDWKEVADPYFPADGSFYATSNSVDPDVWEEEIERMSWHEFYRKICVFEEKMKAKYAAQETNLQPG